MNPATGKDGQQPPTSLRSGFDSVAEIYDRVRPGYPAGLYDDLFSLLPAEPAIVEVGPGTGQATVDLLKRASTVTAVELGERLSEFLRSKFRSDRRLRVLNDSFEDVVLPEAAFDAVVAATAYHWVSEPARLTKPAQILKPGGLLAIIDANQVASAADRGYFDRVQPIYDCYGQGELESDLPRGGDVVPAIFHELGSSALYAGPQLWRYPWDQHYSSRQYGDLVRSYSGSQAMPETEREAMIHDLCAVIDDEFGGTVTRPLVITLTTARATHVGS